MRGLTFYLFGSLLAGATGFGLVSILRGPMTFVLREICGGPERAVFWRRLVIVEVTTIGLALGMFGARPDEFVATTRSAEHAWLVLRQVRWSLIGVIVSLPIIGIGIAALVPAYERRRGAP